MHHIQLAHGLAVERLRAAGHGNLGVVLNFAEVFGHGDAQDVAVDRADAIANRLFIESLTQGTYPDAVLEGLGPHMPIGWQADMAVIATPIDWLGVNYYSRNFVSFDPSSPWPSICTHEGPLPKTQMGWEIFPEGLSNLLTRMARDYVGDLPMVVTENGMASDDAVVDDAVNDETRVAYIRAHVASVAKAIADGANVDGFFYWSLLDNYEWSFGYEKRFGIVHVDFETMKRTPKASYRALQAALAK